MFKLLKKYIAVTLSGVYMLTSLSGCGTAGTSESYSVEEASGTEVMTVGEETVTLDEVYLYVIQCVYTYSLDQETAEESESTYKSTILEQIQDAKAKYQVALTADIEITEETEEQINTTVDNYYAMFGEELFENYGISRDAIYQLFLEQRYITKLQDKSTTELYEDYLAEAQENYGDSTFIEAYYVFFPKTTTDDDGNTVDLSAAEIAEAKQNAETTRNRALAGESLEDIGAEFDEDSGVIADTQRTMIGLYEEALNELLSTMENGEIAEVYEDDAGYMVLQMINNNDTDYREYFLESYAQEQAEQAYSSMEDVWVSAMDISDDDIIGDTWENLSIVGIAKYMDEHNLTLETMGSDDDDEDDGTTQEADSTTEEETTEAE